MSVTFKYDEPEIENVARRRSPSATFSTEVHQSFGTSKFKSVSDWQDVDALMCSVFIYLGLHY